MQNFTSLKFPSIAQLAYTCFRTSVSRFTGDEILLRMRSADSSFLWFQLHCTHKSQHDLFPDYIPLQTDYILPHGQTVDVIIHFPLKHNTLQHYFQPGLQLLASSYSRFSEA